jgi:hypothetical protein
MFGNNLPANKSRRITVPLFDQTGDRNPGQPYFLPDDPVIDRGIIVGIELHLSANIIDNGDLETTFAPLNITATDARQMYLTLYNADGSEKNYYIPLYSLFPAFAYPVFGIKKTVKPYYGKIISRKSYLSIPANAAGISEQYVSMTFYYD